jgi:hypothetical protein
VRRLARLHPLATAPAGWGSPRLLEVPRTAGTPTTGVWGSRPAIRMTTYSPPTRNERPLKPVTPNRAVNHAADASRILLTYSK